MTYNSPPNPVKYVGRLIAIMLNPSILEFKDSTGKFAVDYWKEFRQVLKRRSFIQELFNFDFSSCENPDVYIEVKRLVEENKNVLDENTIHNASVVVLCLYRFALIQLNIVEMKMKIELTQSKQTHAEPASPLRINRSPERSQISNLHRARESLNVASDNFEFYVKKEDLQTMRSFNNPTQGVCHIMGAVNMLLNRDCFKKNPCIKGECKFAWIFRVSRGVFSDPNLIFYRLKNYDSDSIDFTLTYQELQVYFERYGKIDLDEL